ncbi:TH1 protein-domain-containing protein [Syncephalis fuscata]|nr:TH1 protein-domain-containing protein [Syncephalis fuscata]
MAGRELPPRESASALERLTAPDSLLEPNITELLSSYLRSGGNPVQVVTSLSANYRGLPEMYRLLTEEWTRLFRLKEEETTAAISTAIRERIEGAFDSDVLDATYKQNEDIPPWLDKLLEDPGWRATMYRQSEKYPNCVLLNTAIQRIATSANRDEIAGLATASSYLKVFSEIFFSALQRLVQEDDAGLVERLPEFERICCRNAQTFVFSQAILYRLSQESGGRQLQRLRKTLEVAVRDKQESPELVRAIRTLFSELSNNVASTISMILERKRISPGDAVLLYDTFNKDPTSSVEAIRDAEFLDILLATIFTHSLDTTKKDIRFKYIWLLAFIASAQQLKDGSVDTKDVESTQKALDELQQLLPIKYTQAALNTALKMAMSRIDLPIASMAILVWLQHILLDTPFYETYFRVTEIPAPLLLMEEIVVRHPQQRDRVFDLLRRSFEMAVANTSPQTLMALRRALLDRMMAMMYHGYIMPILNYMSEQANQLDESLIVHFSLKMLGMFRPPFRIRFYSPALRIHALATDALLRQPSLTASSVRNPRSIPSSNSAGANSASGGSIQALIAPAEDAATREKAIGWLAEFVDHPPKASPLTRNKTNTAPLSLSLGADNSDVDRALNTEEFALLKDIRSKLMAS